MISVMGVISVMGKCVCVFVGADGYDPGGARMAWSMAVANTFRGIRVMVMKGEYV